MDYSPVIINGHLNNDGYKKVSVLSPSFQYGLTVFEGIRVYPLKNGELNCFLIQEHLNRLLVSAMLLGLTNLPSFDSLMNDINILLDHKKITEDVYIKFILCYLKEGSWAKTDKPDRVCFYYTSKSTFRAKSPKTTKLKISSITRLSTNSLPPKIKCGANYINSRLAYLDVNSISTNSELKYMPIILDDSGHVTESSGSCIFLIQGNIIITPPLFKPILASITRQFIIKSIPLISKDIIFKESVIDRWDMMSADSIFLCGTNAEITMVEEVNDKKLDINNQILYKIFNFMKSYIIQ